MIKDIGLWRKNWIREKPVPPPEKDDAAGGLDVQSVLYKDQSNLGFAFAGICHDGVSRGVFISG
jgi:hypothetical protein